MSASQSEATRTGERDAPHRPPARRFSNENRQQAARRDAARSLGPEAAPFLALAAKRFRAMQRAADTTVEGLTSELESLVSEMSSRGSDDVERVQAIGEALIKQATTVSDRCRRTHDWLEDSVDEPLSEGVALLVRQMICAGAPEGEIEEILLGFGVGDPETAVAQARRDFGV